MENYDIDLMDVILINFEYFEEDGYLYYINCCICECFDLIFFFFVVIILKCIYEKKIILERIEFIEGSYDEICELVFKVNDVL